MSKLRKLFPYPDEVFASLFLAIVAVLSLRRLHYAVDFSDESFYATIAQRYALGDRPFIDEYNLRQTAGLLLAPFYWSYLKLRGSTDGVVYFLRILFFCVQGFTAWTAYRFAGKRVPRAFALVAAALPFAYQPFSIPTCSYNNLGCFLFAAGMFLTLSAVSEGGSTRALVLAGAVHGLSCVAYPPLGVPVAIFAVLVVWVLRTREPGAPLSRLAGYAGGVAIVGFLTALLIAPGMNGFKEALTYERMTTGARTIDKFKGVLKSMDRLSPAHPSSVLTLAVAAVLAKQFPRWRALVFGGMVAYVGYFFSELQPEQGGAFPGICLSLHAAIFLGLLAVFLTGFVPAGEMRRLLAIGVAASVCAGLVTATSSDNPGCMNGGVGLFAAALIAMVAAPLAAQSEGAMSLRMRLATVMVMAVAPAGMLSAAWANVYRDDPIPALTSVVRVGPYRGLATSPGRVAQAEQLTRDVREYAPAGGRILSYYDFPAPYLSAPVRPALQTVWTDSRAKLGWLLPYYRTHRTGQSIAVVIGRSGISPELEGLVESRDRLLVDRGWYRIYREPPP